MDIRTLTDTYAVSPQIMPEDMAAAQAAGIVRIICNRPDAEVPPEMRAQAIAEAAGAAGIDFHILPLTHQTMTPENIARQRALVEEAGGPVLAYCASGTRCSVIWALGAVADLGVDAVLARAAAAGYDLEGLRPTLRQIAGT